MWCINGFTCVYVLHVSISHMCLCLSCLYLPYVSMSFMSLSPICVCLSCLYLPYVSMSFMSLSLTCVYVLQEVDVVHQRLLAAYVALFDTHKHALGWGHKELQIV
jgi:hypothetical protein